MGMNVSRGWVMGIVLLLVSGAAGAAGNADAGKAKTLICQACHGPDGNSPHNPGWSNLTFEDLLRQESRTRGSLVWPKLAGQNPAYLVKQLNNFRSGQRVDPVMSDMVTGLSPADIDDIAVFYGAQTIRPGTAGADAQTLARGKQLFLEGKPASKLPACATCHQVNGHGTPELPRIAGQHAVYLQKQLLAFKRGKRHSENMEPLASQLADDEIKALSYYLTAMP